MIFPNSIRKCCIFAVLFASNGIIGFRFVSKNSKAKSIVMELVVFIALFIVLPLVSVACIVLNGIRSGHSRWKIIINGVLNLLFFLAFYFIVGRVFLNSYASSQKHIKQLDKVFEQEYSSVVFEGRILSVQTVYHFREVSILCIEIDHSNTSDFYRFDEYMGLRIENGVAVVPMGSSHSSENLRKYSYVKVNENHNKKVILSDNKGKSDTLLLDYCHEGMDESNMSICGCE